MTAKYKSPSAKARTGSSAKRRSRRWRLCEAQNWRCAFCGAVLGMDTATTDHVVAIAEGGANTWENKVASCLPCNQRRGIDTHRRRSAIQDWYRRMRVAA